MASIQEIRQKYPQYQDMSDSDLGAALHQKFYSDMPYEEFSQKVGLEPINQEQFGPPTERQMMRQEAGEKLDSMKAGLVGAASGISSGLNDEMMARLAAYGSLPITGAIDVANRMGANIPNPMVGRSLDDIIEQETARNRAQNRAATEGRPYATIAGNITGALVNPLNKVLPTGGGVVNTMIQGGGLAAAQGFGEGEGGAGNRLVNATTTGLTGAAIGGAFGAGANALKYAGKKINPAPTVTKLKEISKKAFQYIDDSKFGFSPNDTLAMSKAMDDAIPKDPQILQRMAKTGDEAINIKAMFDEIYAGKPTSLAAFRDFDSQLTDQITKSYANFKPTAETSRLYKLQNAIREKMDDAMNKATPAVRDAYHVYSQAKKVEDIGNILDRALKTQNPATSLKTQLANYARKARGLDDKEKKMIDLIIKDDLADEVLRSVGSRLVGIGQAAQGNFGEALGQVALSKLSRNALEGRKLAKIDDLTNYIARKAETRIGTMDYLDKVAPALPKYPKLDDIVERPARTRGGSQGIRSIENPNLKTKIRNLAKDESGSVGGYKAKDYERILEQQREVEGLRAAVRDPETGVVYTGSSHQKAMDNAPRDGTGIWPRLYNEWDADTDNVGFINKAGKFISRTEAEKNLGVSTMEDARDFLRNRKLFSIGAQGMSAPLTAGGLGAAGYALSPKDAKATPLKITITPKRNQP